MVDIKYFQPKIKYNNGNGALLCNSCDATLKINLTKDEWNGKTDLLFCEECKLKLNIKG